MAVSLTACGGGGSDAGTTTAAADKPAETTTAAAADKPAEEAKEPAGDGSSLVYWSMWEATEPQGQAIQAAVDKFTEDTGVTVDLQFKGRTGIREGLQPALDAGTNIDLFDEDIDRVNTTWGQYLMDLEELAMGTAAMYLNGSWLPNEVKDMAGDDFVWGCFSYPEVEGGTDGVDAANYGAQVLAINKDSQNAENAFKLICYITQGEFDKMLSELSIGIPADSNNTEWPALISCVKPVMDSMTTRYPWAAGAEANADMTPIIKENFLKLCGGSIDAQGFVDALKKAGN